MAMGNNIYQFIALLSFTIIILYTSIPETVAQLTPEPDAVTSPPPSPIIVPVITVTRCADCGPYGHCLTYLTDGNCTKCTCPDGFTGSCCETPPVVACTALTCPVDENKHFTCVDYGLGLYKCECQAGWTGSECDTEISPCEPNPCVNWGKCRSKTSITTEITTTTTTVSTTIISSTTWSSNSDSPGSLASVLSSSSALPSTSALPPSTSTLPPSTSTLPPSTSAPLSSIGASGSTLSPVSPTTAAMTLTTKSTELEYYCECPKWAEGYWCEKVKNCGKNGDCWNCKYNIINKIEPYCYNGTCFYVDYQKYCKCPERYTGERCEIYLPNQCDPNPCQYGGICEEIDDGADYKCTCLDIWTGKDCSIYDVCIDSKCRNNGTCQALPNNTFECNCLPGWTGKICTIDINECIPNPCQYNSSCTDGIACFECDCVPGTSGDDCSINHDDCMVDGQNPCQKKDPQAECHDGLDSFTCTCSADYTDKDCTLHMAIWNVIKNLDDDVDIIGVLEDIVEKPSIIKDLMPFFLALMMPGDQSVISWNYDDIFFWASYERTELTEVDFRKKYDSSLGNCFTFNSPNLTQDYRLRYSGEKHGFQALLRVRQDEYISWIDTAAILVFVHDPEESIFSESVRYQAAPNEEMTLIVSQNGFVRLGGKYGTCVADKSEAKSYYYDGTYTVDGCLRSCFQDAVKESCGCMDPRYPMPDGEIICSLNQRSCVLNVSDVRGDPSNWDDCKCPVSCSERQQVMDWTTASFPSDPAECWQFTDKKSESYLNCTRDFKDLTKVTVYFPSILQKSFVETPKMSFNQFVSYVGGMLGIFIGVSIVSIIEFIFLVYRLFVTFCLNIDATSKEK